MAQDLLGILVAVVVTGLCCSCCAQAADSAPRGVLTQSQDSYRVPRYDVLELTFALSGDEKVADPLTDVVISVQFTGPGGRVVTVGGFFYGGRTWKARLAPDEVGAWRYAYTARTPAGVARGEGRFECIPSDRPGFLRINPRDPFTWIFDNGTPFWPVGLQDCVFANTKQGTVFSDWRLEGGDRNGPWTGGPVDADTYLRTYAQAGFNLFRFSQDNCSYGISGDLNQYKWDAAAWTDQLLEKLGRYRYRTMYGFFGYAQAFTKEPENAAAMQKVKRFLKYSVDRWGAFVDIWELLNEQEAADPWTVMMADYVRSIDPYHHPIATSWEHPELAPIDVNAPHWYELEKQIDSDTVVAGKAAEWKKFGKPVIVDEAGNMSGAVWDYTSALRMRVRLWTALFEEVSFIFWNTSDSPNGWWMNIYLGPEERQYVQALQHFSSLLQADMKPVKVSVEAQNGWVRAYGLGSSTRTAVYVRFALNNPRASQLQLAKGKITLDVAHAGTGYWISPRDGSLISSLPIAAGPQTLVLPDFQQDCALLITADPVAAPPMPIIKANPQFGLAPQTVVFDGRTSAAAFGGKIASYHWDFWDGATAEGPLVAHTYEYGNYPASLTVTDGSGARATSTVIIRAAASLVAGTGGYADVPGLAAELQRVAEAKAANRPPTASAAAEPDQGQAPLAVRFMGSAADADGTVVAYHWDFGDGATATTLDARHLYLKPGTYQALLTVTDDRGATGSATVTVKVEK